MHIHKFKDLVSDLMQEKYFVQMKLSYEMIWQLCLDNFIRSIFIEANLF